MTEFALNAVVIICTKHYQKYHMQRSLYLPLKIARLNAYSAITPSFYNFTIACKLLPPVSLNPALYF
jgi:hypothetical protein